MIILIISYMKLNLKMLTIKHIITKCRQFHREKQEAGVPPILAEALQPANIQNTI